MSTHGNLTLAAGAQVMAPVPTSAGAQPPSRPPDNPLLQAAGPLLNMLVLIRSSRQAIQPALLREQLIAAIRRFQERAQALSVPVDSIVGARYCLCTALDEAAALTRWGENGVWSAHSLLVIFHNETWGGEKFFQLLSRLIQDPARHWALIELQYYCLVLGFEGRYRIITNGHAQLQGLKQRLRKLLLEGGHGQAGGLAAHWLDPLARRPVQLRRWIPLWLWLALAVLLTAGTYVGLLLALNGKLDASYVAVNSIHLPELEILANEAPASLGLAQLLAADISQGAVRVEDAANHHVITVRGDGLFDTGKAEIRPAYLPVLGRIAAALQRLPGRISVTGFTDDRPIHTAQFPSNQELSTARALSVAAFLKQAAIGPDRAIQTLGLGDAQPVASNASSGGRAMNRRVEIQLFPGTATSSTP